MKGCGCLSAPPRHNQPRSFEANDDQQHTNQQTIDGEKRDHNIARWNHGNKVGKHQKGRHCGEKRKNDRGDAEEAPPK